MAIKVIESNKTEEQVERLEVLDGLESKNMMLSPIIDTKIRQSFRRHKAAVEAGWHLWEPKNEKLGIFVKPPFYKSWYVAAMLILAICAGAGITLHDSWSVMAPWRQDMGVVIAVMGGLSLIGYVIGLIVELTTRPFCLAFRRHDDRVERQWHSGNWNHHSVNVWSAPIPIKIWEKWEKDRHLFDACYIASEDASGFTVVEKNVYSPQVRRWIEPYLIGRIGDDLYVGAVWDMDKEKGLQIAMKESMVHER